MLTRIAATVGALLIALSPSVAPFKVSAAVGDACGPKARPANLNFKLKDLTGREINLNAYRGKVLLIDFWATWCAPCQVEIPGFVDLYGKYKAQGFEVLGLLVQDQPSNARNFVDQHKMTYPVINAEARADLQDAFGPLFALPTSLIVSRDGRLCKQHVGLASIDQFESEIRALLEAPTRTSN